MDKFFVFAFLSETLTRLAKKSTFHCHPHIEIFVEKHAGYEMLSFIDAFIRPD